MVCIQDGKPLTDRNIQALQKLFLFEQEATVAGLKTASCGNGIPGKSLISVIIIGDREAAMGGRERRFLRNGCFPVADSLGIELFVIEQFGEIVVCPGGPAITV